QRRPMARTLAALAVVVAVGACIAAACFWGWDDNRQAARDFLDKLKAEEAEEPGEVDGSPSSAGDVMAGMHARKTALVGRAEAYAREARWEQAGKLTAPLRRYGAALAGFKPPRGSAESWAGLANEYRRRAESLASALEQRDAGQALEEVGSFK